MTTDPKELEKLYQNIKADPVQCREAAKRLFVPENPVLLQNMGIRFLTRAVKLRDPEAMYIMGTCFLNGTLRPLQGKPEERGRTLIRRAQELGFLD